MLSLRTPIETPTRSAPRRGLLLSAPEWPGGQTPFPVTPADDAARSLLGLPPLEPWTAGFAYTPWSCDPPELVPNGCAIDKPDPPDRPDTIDVDPYIVVGLARCTVGDRVQDLLAQARDHLLSGRSFAVEAELWSGALAVTASLPNPRFVNDPNNPATDATPATEPGPALGLAILEAKLAAALHGEPGMIHARPDLVTLWQAASLLTSNGVDLLTVMGTRVIAGAGYPGTGPTGQAADSEQSWAYATPTVYQRSSPILEFGERAEHIDWRANDELELVEQVVAVAWSGCALFAVNVDHTV